MKTAIIMPTIQVPPNLETWAEQLDPASDMIIIVGNGISPHHEIQSHINEIEAKFGLEVWYLHPDDSYCTDLRFNAFMDLNHHHRRNFGLFFALELNADIIITLDDDNFPADDTWVNTVKAMLTQVDYHYDVINRSDGWYDPGKLCVPATTHRGYPLSRRHESTSLDELITFPSDGSAIGVFASLWLGDPDIDAIERIANDPFITSIAGTYVLGVGTWAPFDSQSTAITRELAPLLFMLPGVGRYDDIWASYIARAVMDVVGQQIAYGKPAVRQKRNPHNLLKDLDMERLGYEKTEELCDVLRSWQTRDRLRRPSVMDALNEIVQLINDECPWMPTQAIDGLRAWLADLEERVNI